jgi:membrane protein implicated in regulation of membrane protease activity
MIGSHPAGVIPVGIILIAILIGGFGTFLLLLPFGFITAVIAAPIGASVLGAMAGALLVRQRAKTSGRMRWRDGTKMTARHGDPDRASTP